jgi:Tfp pilus assembly protein PilO
MKAAVKLRGNWLITLPLVGLTIVYVVAFDVPARRTSRELRAELEASQAFVAGGPMIMAQISDAQAQLQQANAYFETWRETAPPGTGSAVLVGEVSRLARAAGTRTTRLEPSSAVDYEELRSVPLTLVCMASFEQAFELLQGIEALPQSVWIDDLRIERKDAKQDDLNCEVKLVVFTDKSDISD